MNKIQVKLRAETSEFKQIIEIGIDAPWIDISWREPSDCNHVLSMCRDCVEKWEQDFHVRVIGE